MSGTVSALKRFLTPDCQGTYVGVYQGQIFNNNFGPPVNGSGQVTRQILNATDNGGGRFKVSGTIQVSPFLNGGIPTLFVTGTHALEQAATATSPQRGQLTILGWEGSTTVNLVGDTITVTEIGTSVFDVLNPAGTLSQPLFPLTLKRI